MLDAENAMSSDYRGTLGQQPNQSWAGYPPPVSANRSWTANPLFRLIIAGSVVVLFVGVLVVGYVTYRALGRDTPEKTVDAYLGAVKEHNNPAGRLKVVFTVLKEDDGDWRICGQREDGVRQDQDLTRSRA